MALKNLELKDQDWSHLGGKTKNRRERRESKRREEKKKKKRRSRGMEL